MNILRPAGLPVVIAVFCVITTAGCTPALKIPDTVKVPVPVPCIAPADAPKRPALLSDAELLALDQFKRTWALWGDRAAREGYQALLEAVVEGCIKISVSPQFPR